MKRVLARFWAISGLSERFVNVPRKIAGPPYKVWINPPAESPTVA